MSGAQRVSRARADRQGGHGRDAAPAAPTHASSPAHAAPAWASGPAAAPFALGGVQRKVAINEPGDAFEREAESVAQRVASGQVVSSESFSAVAPSALGGPPQRAAAPAEKKKEEKPAVQKAAAPEKKEEKPPSATVQKAEKPDEKKEPPKPAPVQKAAAPDEKKKESPKAPPVQKAAKPEEKKPAPVQKAAAPDKKKDDKPASVQKTAAPADKKKEEKPSTVQKAAAPTEKKKDEKPPAVQKAASSEKKKEDKPASAVQKAAADDKKKEPAKPAPVQKAAKVREKREGETLEDKLKDAPVQKAAAPEKKKEEPPKPAVQKASGSSGSVTPSMESAAAEAIQRKGVGEPMNSGTRGALESRMGADLSGVRVHQDSAARQASSDIGARAFTHGSDIWLGHGESQSDVGLMAHEATHVVQQNAGVGRMLVQRIPKAAEEDADADWEFESPEGKIDRKSKQLWIPKLQVPTFKTEFTPSPLKLPPRKEIPKRTDEQRQKWEEAAGAGKMIEEKIDEKCKENNAPDVQQGGESIYFLELKGQDFYIIGTKKKIKERALRPFWDKEGKKGPFDVDHKQEHQLTRKGEDPDRLKNLWLLEASANRSAGSNIKHERDDRVQQLLNAATRKKEKKGGKPKKAPQSAADSADAAAKGKPIFNTEKDAEEIQDQYSVTFAKIEGGLDPKGKPKSWALPDIKEEAKHFAHIRSLTPKEIKHQGMQGSAKKLVVYTNETGGGLREVPWKEGSKKQKADLHYGAKAFRATEVEYDESSKTGMIRGTAYHGHKLIKGADIELPIRPMDAVLYGGYIPNTEVSKEIGEALGIFGLSPIEMYSAELTTRGFVGRGRVLPTVPLIKDIGIDLVLDGDDVYLSKTFSAGELKFPGPIQVTAASLEVFAGTGGVGARGDVYFEVERVGRGHLYAKGSTGGGFAICGEFDFDSEIFDPASIEVCYKYVDGKGSWSGIGKIGIPKGKVRGIESALLTVSFVDDMIDATGVVKPNIPAVEQGSMEFHYSPETGIVIGARLDMKKDTPGIESGWVSAELAKRKGEDRWKVKAHGEAVPKIPGVNAKVIVDYDDGLFDALATADYEKGMLKGSITIGATNRPVSPDGVPAAGPPPDKATKVVLYGGGSLTLKLSPWLQATAAIRLLPNGEIEVTGKIGLPATLELFKGKELQKNIFKVGIDIPIVGISVAGQRIGIFANISGGADLNAGIGPGELQQLELGVTYNPSHEDQTHVFGGAKLHIPAHAGLRLFVRGSLGVGIPLVSASAGIELGGELGIAGALDAAVQVDWTPAKGLDIQALAEVYAEPKFKFDITGFVLVELDTWVHTWELYSKKWQLASVEYGSGLRLGLKLPIHYQEGKPFDISLSDVQFEVPTIEPGSLLEGLVKKIA